MFSYKDVLLQDVLLQDMLLQDVLLQVAECLASRTAVRA